MVHFGDFLLSARTFIHGLLSKVNLKSITAESIDTITAQGIRIANEIHSRDIPDAIKDTAQLFLHSMLLARTKPMLDDQDVTEMVDKSVALAQNLHDTIPVPEEATQEATQEGTTQEATAPAEPPAPQQQAVVAEPATPPAEAVADAPKSKIFGQVVDPDPWDEFYANQNKGT